MTVTDDVIEGEVLPAVVQAAPVTLFQTNDPVEVVRKASEVATELANVVRERGLSTKIGKAEHVNVEGWTLLGTMLGVFPVEDGEATFVEIGGVPGFRATFKAVTRDGAIIGRGTSYCMRDEPTWRSRSLHTLSSMAQTRAASRALRMPLGFVMSLAGYSATPAEEIIDEKTANRVNAKTGEIVEPGAGTAASRTPPATEPQSTEPQATLDTYVPPEPGPDDVPFESTAPPPAEQAEFLPHPSEEAQDEVLYEPAQMARAALIRRTLGVVVSHGVGLTEEQLFDEIEKKAKDGRSVFYGFTGDEFEDLTESQAKKVMDWIEHAAKKHRESQ